MLNILDPECDKMMGRKHNKAEERENLKMRKSKKLFEITLTNYIKVGIW